MRYFDALKRKKTYISAGQKKFSFNLKGNDYLDIPIGERYEFINNWIKNENFDDAFAIDLVVHILDEGDVDDILTDDEVFDIMSNVAAAFARKFPKQTIPVLSPSDYFMETLPVTPVTTLLLTTEYVVNKPFQITISRTHPESGSSEEITFI